MRQLEYLVACVDAGSLVAAAERLNVSQPSVSTAVAKLEAQLGVQLLIRHHAQGVVPTAHAQQHIQAARNLLSHAMEFQRAADASTTDMAGEISLGSFTSLAPTYLPGLIVQMQQQHPGVALHTSEGTQNELIAGLRGGKQQLALVYDHELPDELHKLDLLDATPGVLLPAGHRLARRKRVALAQLAAEPLVLLDVSPSRGYFTGLFHQQGLEPNVAYRSSSLELVRGLVGRGLGYSILVTRPPGDLTYDGQPLAFRPLSDTVQNSRIVLCRLRTTRTTRLLQTFESLVQTYFASFRQTG